MRRKSRAAWHKIILNARHSHDVLFKIRNLLVIGYVSTGGLFFIFVLRDVSLYSWHQAFTSNLHMYKQDQKFWKTLNSSVSISFYELSHNVTLTVWYACFPWFLLVIFHNHVKTLMVLQPEKWNSNRKRGKRMVWIKRPVCKGITFIDW